MCSCQRCTRVYTCVLLAHGHLQLWVVSRVKQTRIYGVTYVYGVHMYFGQTDHQIYGHIRCVYGV
jgi:hypothetical protein